MNRLEPYGKNANACKPARHHLHQVCPIYEKLYIIDYNRCNIMLKESSPEALALMVQGFSRAVLELALTRL
jgi:hypothetical protein